MALGIVLILPVPLTMICIAIVWVLPSVVGVAARNTSAIKNFWVIVPSTPALFGVSPPIFPIEYRSRAVKHAGIVVVVFDRLVVPEVLVPVALVAVVGVATFEVIVRP